MGDDGDFIANLTYSSNGTSGIMVDIVLKKHVSSERNAQIFWLDTTGRVDEY
jgi:hypothetical protein